MTNPEVIQNAYKGLDILARWDRDSAVWGAYGWLLDNSAGYPVAALMQEESTSSAKWWADAASPVELECYLLAAATKLHEQKSALHGKHIKRLIAVLYKNMSPDERVAFKAWMEKQE